MLPSTLNASARRICRQLLGAPPSCDVPAPSVLPAVWRTPARHSYPWRHEWRRCGYPRRLGSATLTGATWTTTTASVSFLLTAGNSARNVGDDVPHRGARRTTNIRPAPVDVGNLWLEELLENVSENPVGVGPRAPAAARRRAGLRADARVRVRIRIGVGEASPPRRVLEVTRELGEEVRGRAFLLVLVRGGVGECARGAGAEERVVLGAPGGVGEDVVCVGDGLLLSAERDRRQPRWWCSAWDEDQCRAGRETRRTNRSV